MQFIGRQAELQKLSRFLERSPDSLAVVYGRRRVGKSELLRQAIRASNLPYVFFECRQTSESQNLAALQESISTQLNEPQLAFESLENTLVQLFRRAEDKPMVVVLDEYPYLHSLVKGIDSIFQALVDRYTGRSKLKLILCGSYIDIMTAILDYANPLYGRAGLVMHLKPMDYLEASGFYPDYSDEDKVRLYSVFGGIPAYTRKIDSLLSVKDNILNLIGAKDSQLAIATNHFLVSEISKVNNANLVFSELSKGALRFSDLLAKTKLANGATLTYTLDKLMSMGLIEKRAPINDEGNKRRTLYRISDPLTSYYYRFVERYQDSILLMGEQKAFETFVETEFETQYVPKAFEEICRQFLIRRNRMGRIRPPFFKIGRYAYDLPKERRNGEFDVVTQDTDGFICYEVKFRNRKLTQSDIDNEIRQVVESPLPCSRFGFVARCGYEGVKPADNLSLYTLADLYDPENFD